MVSGQFLIWSVVGGLVSGLLLDWLVVWSMVDGFMFGASGGQLSASNVIGGDQCFAVLLVGGWLLFSRRLVVGVLISIWLVVDGWLSAVSGQWLVVDGWLVVGGFVLRRLNITNVKKSFTYLCYPIE